MYIYIYFEATFGLWCSRSCQHIYVIHIYIYTYMYPICNFSPYFKRSFAGEMKSTLWRSRVVYNAKK